MVRRIGVRGGGQWCGEGDSSYSSDHSSKTSDV